MDDYRIWDQRCLVLIPIEKDSPACKASEVSVVPAQHRDLQPSVPVSRPMLV